MKATRFVVAAIILVGIFASKFTFADTYQIFNLGNDAARGFYGMDDSGNVVLVTGELSCGNGNPLNLCYETYSRGVFTGVTATTPALAYDNGTRCTPAVPAGVSVYQGVCNNGREAFFGTLTPSQVFPNVYEGSPFTFVAAFGGSPIQMNANGDIVWDDPYFDSHWVQAIDLTSGAVPEPNSVLLFGSGALAMLGAIRRRFHEG